MKVFVLISVVFRLLAPDPAFAAGLSAGEAVARHATAHKCARSGDHLCAFKNAHQALSNSAYLASLHEKNGHVHLAEWGWYAGYAFDAAQISSPAEKRRIVELAIATLTRKPHHPSRVETAGLHVLRAEACLALADNECAQASAGIVAERQNRPDGNGQALPGSWYIPHSRDAPDVDSFRLRVEAVIRRLR